MPWQKGQYRSFVSARMHAGVLLTCRDTECESSHYHLDIHFQVHAPQLMFLAILQWVVQRKLFVSHRLKIFAKFYMLVYYLKKQQQQHWKLTHFDRMRHKNQLYSLSPRTSLLNTEISKLLNWDIFLPKTYNLMIGLCVVFTNSILYKNNT